MIDLIVGIDVGGTSTKTCLVSGLDIIASTTLPTDLVTPEDLGTFVLAAVQRTVDEHGVDLDQVRAVGIGVPGEVEIGVVRNAANLGIGELGFDLARYVSAALQRPVTVENDMQAAAHGCYRQAVLTAPELRNLVYVGLGTGIASGAVIEGRVFRGSRGLAGEFGHVPMGTGLLCVCGSIGCLETVVGAAGIRSAWKEGDASALFEAATAGDADAGVHANRVVDYLAQAIWWLAAAYDPEVLYIGGGVGRGTPALTEMLLERWAELAEPSPLARKVLDPERIRVYDMLEPVGAYGAALLAVADPGSEADRDKQDNLEEVIRQ